MIPDGETDRNVLDTDGENLYVDVVVRASDRHLDEHCLQPLRTSTAQHRSSRAATTRMTPDRRSSRCQAFIRRVRPGHLEIPVRLRRIETIGAVGDRPRREARVCPGFVSNVRRQLPNAEKARRQALALAVERPDARLIQVISPIDQWRNCQIGPQFVFRKCGSAARFRDQFTPWPSGIPIVSILFGILHPSLLLRTEK